MLNPFQVDPGGLLYRALDDVASHEVRGGDIGATCLHFGYDALWYGTEAFLFFFLDMVKTNSYHGKVDHLKTTTFVLNFPESISLPVYNTVS